MPSSSSSSLFSCLSLSLSSSSLFHNPFPGVTEPTLPPLSYLLSLPSPPSYTKPPTFKGEYLPPTLNLPLLRQHYFPTHSNLPILSLPEKRRDVSPFSGYFNSPVVFFGSSLRYASLAPPSGYHTNQACFVVLFVLLPTASPAGAIRGMWSRAECVWSYEHLGEGDSANPCGTPRTISFFHLRAVVFQRSLAESCHAINKKVITRRIKSLRPPCRRPGLMSTLRRASGPMTSLVLWPERLAYLHSPGDIITTHRGRQSLVHSPAKVGNSLTV